MPRIASTRAPESIAPFILRTYISFALVVTLLSLSLFFAPALHRLIVPYTGWYGLSVYLFTLYFAFIALRTGRRRQVFNVARLLALAIVFGFLDMFSHSGPKAAQPDFGNPYLIYNNLRPLFTITVPAIWLFLLLSPPMKRWVREAD